MEIHTPIVHWAIIVTIITNSDTYGLVQDCSISIALAMEIMQYCTKPSITVVAHF